MITIAVSKVIELVNEFDRQDYIWHYHLLTPDCQLNTTDGYMLFIEDVSNELSYGVESLRPNMDLSKRLAEMVHGSEVMDITNTSLSYNPSRTMEPILHLIADLTNRGINWHHHVFFPGCVFNDSTTDYSLVLEDPTCKTRLVSNTKTEPIEDLKQIEAAFYDQPL